MTPPSEPGADCRLTRKPYGKLPPTRPEAITRGRDEMLGSLATAVEAASGDGRRFLELAARMTVLELCERLGNNDVRFVYAPGHIKRLAPDSAYVVVGEFTLLVEGGRVKGVAVNGQELACVQSVEVRATPDGRPTVRLEFHPSQSYPDDPWVA